MFTSTGRRRRFITRVNNGLSRLLHVDPEDYSEPEQLRQSDEAYVLPPTPSELERLERGDKHEVIIAEIRLLATRVKRNVRTRVDNNELLTKIRELVADLKEEIPENINALLNDLHDLL